MNARSTIKRGFFVIIRVVRHFSISTQTAFQLELSTLVQFSKYFCVKNNVRISDIYQEETHTSV
jgi:hypothetical protein